jgi:hypothetical protein
VKILEIKDLRKEDEPEPKPTKDAEPAPTSSEGKK